MIPRKDQLDRKVVATAITKAMEEVEQRYRRGEMSLSSKLNKLDGIRTAAEAIGLKPSEIGR